MFARITALVCALGVAVSCSVAIEFGLFLPRSAPVDVTAIDKDWRAVNSLSVSPWLVVEQYEVILEREHVAPEIEVVCLRTRIMDVKKKLARVRVGEKEAEAKIALELRQLKGRLESIEYVNSVRDRALDYLTGVPMMEVARRPKFRPIFLEAIKDQAALGRLTWERARPFVPLLFVGIKQEREPKAAARGRGASTKPTGLEGQVYGTHESNKLLQALGDMQDPRILEEIAKYFPEQPAEDPVEHLYLQALVSDVFLLPGRSPLGRRDWLEILRSLRGRMVWQVGGISLQYLGSSESGEDTPFFKISWAALYLNRDVYLANGRFCQKLSAEEVRKLKAFRSLPEKTRSKVAIAAWRKRTLGKRLGKGDTKPKGQNPE